MAFPARLRELRESAGLTQGDLAKRAGLSIAGVTQLEQGRRKPAWETVQKLAAALGVSCEAFNEPPASDDPAPRGRPRKASETPSVADADEGGAAASKSKGTTSPSRAKRKGA
jgi:transcriptional regulator with XRE-family HTH domain